MVSDEGTEALSFACLSLGSRAGMCGVSFHFTAVLGCLFKQMNALNTSCLHKYRGML